MEAYKQCLMFFSPLEQMNGKRLMCQQTDKKCSHESAHGAGARCEGTKSSFQHEKNIYADEFERIFSVLLALRAENCRNFSRIESLIKSINLRCSGCEKRRAVVADVGRKLSGHKEVQEFSHLDEIEICILAHAAPHEKLLGNET